MAKQKILFLPKYPTLGASSRLRTYQFLPLWEQEGHQVRVSSFFNEKYLKRFYSKNNHHPLNVMGCYFRRLWVLLGAWRYDLIWIEKELFPFLPSYGEWILEKSGKGYVVDYDDAVFHNYDLHSSRLVRYWMGDKIDWVMRHSRQVLVGNAYLYTRAKAAGAKNIQLLPTVIDPKKYSLKTYRINKLVRLGWIGSPTTDKYLRGLLPVLEKLADRIQLVIINRGDGIGFSGTQELIAWSEETEVAAIQSLDIGIMPLENDKWEQGKCAYKLIQYLACGVPVVASPVGMNTEVVRDGENGFLASDLAEWEGQLLRLIEDPALREEMGRKGFKRVSAEYTLDKNFQKMLGILGFEPK
ncbi:glycosyltransferase family 4 protein [Algoriphagus sp.]|uniref:glycosyltransferase family 4 protein n=1 Tax=Algoriphagus sp. TaxID=1872435 RepID=UPI003F6E8E3A